MSDQPFHEVSVPAVEGIPYAEDLPRIVRSDMTDITELMAKYRWFEVLLRGTSTGRENNAAADALGKAVDCFVAARTALQEAGFELQVLPPVAGMQGHSSSDLKRDIEDANEDEAPQAGRAVRSNGERGPLDRVDCGGKATLLSNLLYKAGLVSSTGKARLGIREGYIKVDGDVISSTVKMLEPGTYLVQVGDGEPRKLTVF